MSKTNFKEKFLENILKQVILLLFPVIVWFVTEAFEIDLFYLLKNIHPQYSGIIVLLLLLSSAVILIYYLRMKNKTADAVNSKKTTLKYCMLIMICISLLISFGHILPTMNLSGKVKIESNDQDVSITMQLAKLELGCAVDIRAATEQKRLNLITELEYRNEIKRIKKTALNKLETKIKGNLPLTPK